MASFNRRPSRPLAITMVVAAAVLVLFGLSIFIREGFPWFAAVWLAAAAVVLGLLARRLLGRSR